MAKLVMGQPSVPSIVFGAGANHYRFLGLEVTRLATQRSRVWHTIR